ncbi:hypothetical protein EVAR_3428_1 [Eumeta japonica]|uniref:Uncharacterized protein n=1 Tax=Eumeta variegata TaxID=151549 RepID=A0A4C1SV52_EUMVA|nr:hypothetical protein EVAR_3428_1 [Eumeta japonica]
MERSGEMVGEVDHRNSYSLDEMQQWKLLFTSVFCANVVFRRQSRSIFVSQPSLQHGSTAAVVNAYRIPACVSAVPSGVRCAHTAACAGVYRGSRCADGARATSRPTRRAPLGAPPRSSCLSGCETLSALLTSSYGTHRKVVHRARNPRTATMVFFIHRVVCWLSIKENDMSNIVRSACPRPPPAEGGLLGRPALPIAERPLRPHDDAAVRPLMPASPPAWT